MRISRTLHAQLLVTTMLLVGLFPASCDASDAQQSQGHGESTDLADSQISPLDDSGNLVQFGRDIAPILRTRCLECHGPEDAKADMRVDDADSLLSYVEAGDVESSMLYTDHLTTSDEELLMPPKEKGGPLSPSEIALIRLWIEEGAQWPEGFQVQPNQIQSAPAAEPQVYDDLSLADRLWKALGYLHPAAVHFPIALFMLGAGFVVVGWKWPSVGTQIPLTCMLIGTATSIAVVAMGWSLAPTSGYGSSWEFLSFEREVDAHRWSAVIVTLLATGSSILALLAFVKDNPQLHRAWKAGLLLCGITIGLVGHQGGEMTYGRDFYPEMFRILTGQPSEPSASRLENEGEQTPDITDQADHVSRPGNYRRAEPTARIADTTCYPRSDHHCRDELCPRKDPIQENRPRKLIECRTTGMSTANSAGCNSISASWIRLPTRKYRYWSEPSFWRSLVRTWMSSPWFESEV